MGVSSCSTSKLGICSPGFLDPSFLPAQWEGAGGAGGAASATTGGFPHWGSVPPMPIPQEGSSGGSGLNGAANPSLPTPVDSFGCCCVLGQGFFHTDPGPSWCSELLLGSGSRVWSSSLQAWFWKTHVGGSRGTAGRGDCPALGCKNLQIFYFFKRLFPIFPHPNP